jgi:hypothetical protein
MSRAKIVKANGAEPDEFENLVAQEFSNLEVSEIACNSTMIKTLNSTFYRLLQLSLRLTCKICILLPQKNLNSMEAEKPSSFSFLSDN